MNVFQMEQSFVHEFVNNIFALCEIAFIKKYNQQ